MENSTREFDGSVEEAFEIEKKKAHGNSKGEIMVKIWFHQDFIHPADFCERFLTFSEAKKATQFLKEMKGVAACYIVKIKPFSILEKVVNFNK